MNETEFGLRRCPECGGNTLIPVTAGEQTNVFCEDCVLCWHLEFGQVTVVDPKTCPGCQLGITACFERWDMSTRSAVGSPATTPQDIGGPGGSNWGEDAGWDDIKEELYSSTREASVGWFPLGGL